MPSPLERSSKIEIVRGKRKIDIDKINKYYQINKWQSQKEMAQVQAKNLIGILKKRKTMQKKDLNLPLKKNWSMKQFFETSDRISYNFDKIVPFSTKAKRSISESIKFAQKSVKTKEPERKFIKASGYYLHNFMMSSDLVKGSLLKFKLDEILKEK